MIGLFFTLQLVAAPPLTDACDDLELAPLSQALVDEINVMQKRSGPALQVGERRVTPLEYATKTLRPLYTLAAAGDKAALCGAMRDRFAWYKLAPQILFTAYHTPSVRASLTADETFRWPLYRRPPDATKHSTAQILAGSLRGRGLELVWLSDPYDALAIQVEGSANLTLPDGSAMAIGTDGHNGMAYTNVSKLLAADGKMPAGPPPPSSAPGNPKARAFFTQHPAELDVYWGRNPHFVYFKRVARAGGGKLGVLVPHRSIAVDASQVPLGGVVFVRAPQLERVTLAQDTGAGIRGARIDVFFGDDEQALAAAQALSVQGEAWLLIAK